MNQRVSRTPRETTVSNDDLATLLKRLHTELSRATTLDDESRELLSVLATDFARFGSQLSTARRFAMNFETDHPDVAAVLRQLTDLFSKGGV